MRLDWTMSTFGERLKQARERAGLSQEALGAASGVRLGTIWRYEKDSQEPRLSVIRDLASALNCDAGWLVSGDRGEDESTDTAALDAFLETRLGKTATGNEVRSLRSLRAFTGRPTVDTYHSMLLALRGTLDPVENTDVAARADDLGAMKVKRR